MPGCSAMVRSQHGNGAHPDFLGRSYGRLYQAGIVLGRRFPIALRLSGLRLCPPVSAVHPYQEDLRPITTAPKDELLD